MPGTRASLDRAYRSVVVAIPTDANADSDAQ